MLSLPAISSSRPEPHKFLYASQDWRPPPALQHPLPGLRRDPRALRRAAAALREAGGLLRTEPLDSLLVSLSDHIRKLSPKLVGP
jgi:hypothetical protein